jgi:[ribosomal protein S18]-alanine N-acetyltransferase
MTAPAGIVIRDAGLGDIPAVHALEEISFPVPWRPEFFSHEIGVERRLNLVAVDGATIIGYLFATWLLDEMHINKIAVRASHRRRGIADALMAKSVEVARGQKVEIITLEVRRSNSGAQAFYTHLGFTSSFVRRRYYPDGEDAVFMTCNVDSAED